MSTFRFIENRVFSSCGFWPLRFIHLVSSSHRLPLTAPASAALTEKLRRPHLIDGLVGVLHDVELVVDVPHCGAVLLNAQPVRLPHIDTGRLDPRLFPRLGSSEKRRQAFPCSGSDPNHSGSPVEIAHHRQELVLLPK